MGVLAKINTLKSLLKSIEESAFELPDDLVSIVEKDMKNVRILVNTLGINIEKYFKDQKNIQVMSKDILHRMNKFDIYQGLSNEQKNAIIEKIIGDKDLILIGPDDLREYIKDKLQTEDAEDLIKKAYSKRDIIHLGDAVSKADAGEIVKYEAGMNILRGMVQTPTGRKDAITHGIKRLIGNTVTLHYYLLLYYGIR